MVEQMIPIGDTPRVAAGFLKQNFKVKFESRNIKVIAWQHSQKIGEKHSGFQLHVIVHC